MNKKAIILSTINLLQRLSQAYNDLDIGWMQDTYGIDELVPSKLIELEVQQQILELEQLLSEYSEKSCEVCERRHAADNL